MDGHEQSLRVLIMAALVAALLFVSCEGGHSPAGRNNNSIAPPTNTPVENSSDDGGPGVLPTIASLDEVIDASQCAEQGLSIVSQGSESGRCSTNSSQAGAMEKSGTSLILRAFSRGEYACAIFAQDVGSSYSPLAILTDMQECVSSLNTSNTLPLNYYIGIADFSMGSWRWFGPFTQPNTSVTLSADSNSSLFKSPQRRCYISVLVGIGEGAAEIPGEGLVADMPFTVPASVSSVGDNSVGVMVRSITTAIGEDVATLPAAVGRVTASATMGEVRLSWEPSVDISSVTYEVLRDDEDDETAPAVLEELDSTIRECSDATGVPGKNYAYSVRVHSSVGYSGGVDVTSGRQLAAPTAIASDHAGDKIMVCWRASEGATGYAVSWATAEGEEMQALAEVGAGEFGYDDETPQMNESRWYRIQAIGEDFNSPLGFGDIGTRQEGERVWWMKGRDNVHSRCAPFAGPQSAAINWRQQLPFTELSGAVVDSEGQCYVSSFTGTSGYLYSLSVDGQVEWEYECGQSTSMPAIGLDGTIYVVSNMGKLHAVYPSGERKWVFECSMLLSFAPAIGPDGIIYITGRENDQSLFAIDPSTGEALWVYTNEGLDDTPTIAEDGTVYVGYTAKPFGPSIHMLRAIKPNGELKWECEIPLGNVGSPTIGSDGTLYVGTNNGFVAMTDDGTSGTIKWVFEGTFGYPAVTADGIIYITDDHSILAIRDDGLSATFLWSQTISQSWQERFASEPAVDSDGAVYMGSDDGCVYSFTSDGNIKWTCDVGASVVAGPTLAAGGKLYVTCNNGQLISIGNSSNEFPQAEVTTDVVEGDAPLTVNFDGSASFDPDGTIEYYDWDWGEDSFHHVFEGTGSSPFASHEYSTGGDYTCRLRTVDNNGAFGEVTENIAVHGWGTKPIGEELYTGQYPSLAEVSGRPAVAFSGRLGNDLSFARSLDAHGNTWGAPVLVDDMCAVGRCTALKIVNGYPAIAYYDAANDYLKFVRSSDVDGNVWQMPVVVDSAGDVGSYTSLAVVDGNPAILYFDATNEDLKYVRANNSYGEIWGTPVIVEDDYSQEFPTYASLVVANGAPATAYYDRPTYNLVFNRALDSHGDSWGVPVVVDDMRLAGGGISLSIVDGCPAIAYDAFVNPVKVVKFIRAADADGASWGNPYYVSTDRDYGRGPVLSVINGKPFIAYSEWENPALKLVSALDTLGDLWSVPVTISLDAPITWHPSPTEVDGKPAIAHVSDTSYRPLKFTYLY